MKIGVIGAGRVGASFVLAFPRDITGILCSTKEHTEETAKRLHVRAYDDGAALAAASDIVILSVRDDGLDGAAQKLAEALSGDFPRKTCFFHVSGARDLSPLSPLKKLGYAVGSIHPLQSFAAPSAENLHDTYMAVDGDERAKAIALRLVKALGSTPFFVPEKERMLYHAAACFCSNYVVTAVAAAQQLMARWMPSEEDAAKALWPLIAGTTKNLEKQQHYREALTGPISRGDVGTVRKHMAVLPEPYKSLYASLGLATADLAEENGTITRGQHDAMKEMMK